MKKLITLEENNNISFTNNNSTNEPKLNGVECPLCKMELYDTNPMMTLMTYPAQKAIHCSNCDYTGYRLV